MTVHRHRFRVRYGETDQMGFVHHSVYLLYFEEGRTGLLRELGRSYAELERSGTVLPVVDAGLRFRTPARYDEELVVEARVTEVTGVRVRFDYRVLHAADGATYNTAMAFVDVGKVPEFSCAFPFRVKQGTKLKGLQIESATLDLSKLN